MLRKDLSPSIWKDDFCVFTLPAVQLMSAKKGIRAMSVMDLEVV